MGKIIEITANDHGLKCLLCCKTIAKLKLKIVRPVQGDTVSSFHLCDACLAQMQNDIQTTE